MTKNTFNKLKEQVIIAHKKMIDIGYNENELILIINEKYKNDGDYDKNIAFNYDNLDNDVDFILMSNEDYKRRGVIIVE